MTAAVHVDAIMNPPARVQRMRRAVDTVHDGLEPLIDLCQPYVDGLENLPEDGRFLLVGNHTQFGIEALLIPHFVRRTIGTRVRPLADRLMSQSAARQAICSPRTALSSERPRPHAS